MLQRRKNFNTKKILLFIFIFILTISIMEYSPTVIRYFANQFK